MQYSKLLLTIFFLVCGVRGQAEESCGPPCDCSSVASCVGDQPEDKCDCCRRCSHEGDDCGGEGGKECLGNLLCLPNDPYSSNYNNGKCFQLSDCLSFGCTDETGDCNCLYSSTCPLKRFPYYTFEECAEALLRKRCEGITCPPQLTEQDCKEGMYFEQGPSYYNDCCPVGGSCVCNMSACSSQPKCDSNSRLVVRTEADESLGQCCDQYECQKVPGCIHENHEYSLNETWIETACEKCQCTANGVFCTFMDCPQLEDCETTYVPEGTCCPECFEATKTNRPQGTPFSVDENGCVTNDGLTFHDGEVFRPGACRVCKCEKKLIICEEKMCEPLICEDDQAVMEDECCPKCIDKIDSPTMEEDNNETMHEDSPYTPTPVYRNTGSVGDGTTMGPPSNKPAPSNYPAIKPSSTELVMVLDAPFAEVNRKWEDFSLELVSMLKSHNLSLLSMDVKEDKGETVLILNVMSTSHTTMENEFDLALMVSRAAQDYSLVGKQKSQISHDTGPLGSDEGEFNITIVVLTLIAAIALVSFIGVFVGVILITRRLKTMKAIKGQSYKKRSSIRP